MDRECSKKLLNIFLNTPVSQAAIRAIRDFTRFRQGLPPLTCVDGKYIPQEPANESGNTEQPGGETGIL